MTVDNIYNALEKKSIGITGFFGRKLITIADKDFYEYERYFVPTKNLFNRKINYRTKNMFKHIHAIRENGFVQLHYDYGNSSENIIMAIPHLFIDVIPYFLWHLLHLKKPYQMDTAENNEGGPSSLMRLSSKS
jgi:hypothetical protein